MSVCMYIRDLGIGLEWRLTDGFKSLCAKFSRCMIFNPSSICEVMLLTSASGTGPDLFSRKEKRSPPLRYSMAMKSDRSLLNQPSDLTKQWLY